jgi:hypothetical protein
MPGDVPTNQLWLTHSIQNILKPGPATFDVMGFCAIANFVVDHMPNG